MTDAITITESEFNKDILSWLTKARKCQLIVVDNQGNTKIVMGTDSLHIADDFDLEDYLSGLPESEGDIDMTHNPWLE